MKRLFLISLVLIVMPLTILAQSPNKFNYQAVIRDNSNELLVNKTIKIRVSIFDGIDSETILYSEVHSKSTNAYGVVNIIIGDGTDVSGDFSSVSWDIGDKYLKIEIDDTGNNIYIEVGEQQLLSVPYALHSNSSGTLGNENVYSPLTDTLFVVKDHDGNIVFAVFPDGAAVYVNENAKGKIGGFAVSGRSPAKAIDEDYLIVTSDSTRIYVNDTTTKGKIGGFSISGRSPAKGTLSSLMDLTRDNYFIGHEAGINNTTGLYNSFMGYNAGFSNTIGNRNTFLGYYSGYLNTSGYSNIFIGDSTGYSNETGIYNIFLGNESGRSNISGSGNIFLGSTAGYNNETGYKNVFVGSWCGFYNTTGNDNIFVGYRSGWNNTVGYRNVFIGTESGFGNIDGRYNVFIGDNAGYSNTTGGGNVVIGATSGYLNTSGFYNVFVGNWSGRSNTIGHENIFVGNRSGWYNTEGYKNIFIGSFSGYQNELGSNNIFFGDSAGYTNTVADNNIFIGNKSGFANSIGSRNVFLGFQSGYTNETGGSNVFLGNNSGYSNTTGYKNVFIGDSTGYLNNIGRYNVFIGDKVGYSNTEGIANVIIGATAGQNNTTGTANTFVGNWSGNKNETGNQNVFLGNQAGWNNISGGRNVYLGSYAGWNNTAGWNNIFIGNNAGANELGSSKLYIDIAGTDSTNTLIWGDFYNNIIRINGKLGINTHPEVVLELVDTSGSAVIIAKGIGDDYSYAKLVLMSDEVQDKSWDIRHNKSNNFELEYNDGLWHDSILIVSNTGNLTTGGSVIPFNDSEDSLGTSSKRWNVVYATNGAIQTSDKRLKDNIEDIDYGLEQILNLRPVSFNWRNKLFGNKKLGFVAQEVQPIMKEVVDVGNDENQTLGINYTAFVAVLIKGMQEQQVIIENQKTKITSLEERLTKIEKLLKTN